MVLAIEAAGGKALAIRADSADVEAVKHAVAQTVKHLRSPRYPRKQRGSWRFRSDRPVLNGGV